jgi:hypothetical protein
MGVPAMSQLISRILLTILIFPSAALVLFVSFIFIEQVVSGRDEAAFVICTLFTCAYMIAYWLILWRRSVVWTTRRWNATFLATTFSVAFGIGLGVAINAAQRYSNPLNIMFGSLSATVFWMIATIIVWRETPDERAARLSRAGADALVCPTCGYNLTGLHEARCPECGAHFTLNELLAGQPSRATAEVEQV